MASGFENLIMTGKQVGIFDFYLPFVLSFAIIYGILRKIKIFGDEKVGKTTDLIISLILSVFAIGYTPVGVTLAAFFGTMFTGTVMIVVTLLGTIMILYILGKLVGIDIPGAQDKKKWTLALLVVALLLAAAAFWVSGGMSFFGSPSVGFTLPALPSVNISMQDAVIFGAFILFIAAVVYMAREEGGKKGK